MMRWSVICKEHKLLLQGTLVTWKTVQMWRLQWLISASNFTDQWCSKRNSWALSNQGASDVRLGHDLPGSAEGCKMYHFSTLGSHGILCWQDTIHSHWKQLLIRKCCPWALGFGVFHWYSHKGTVWSVGSFWWKKSCTTWDVENLAKVGYMDTLDALDTLPISVRTFRQISDPQKVEL